jgi:hypothetical protein
MGHPLFRVIAGGFVSDDSAAAQYKNSKGKVEVTGSF